MTEELPHRDADEPHMYDVLLGRGTAVAQHFGNAFFRQLVDEHRPLYQETKKNDKCNVARSIIQTITQKGGSFVKAVMVGGKRLRYQSVSLTVARGKTSQALRELKMSTKRQGMIQKALCLLAVADDEHDSVSPKTPMKISPAVSRKVPKAKASPLPRLPTNKRRKCLVSRWTTPAKVLKKCAALSKKKKKTKKRGYTAAEWDAVMTPTHKTNSLQAGATPHFPVKPSHSRTTRAAIQAQKLHKNEMANKVHDTQHSYSEGGIDSSPTLVPAATFFGSFGSTRSNMAVGESQKSSHVLQLEALNGTSHRIPKLPINKQPLSQLDHCLQQKEVLDAMTTCCPTTDAAATACSQTSDRFIRIVPSPLKCSNPSVSVQRATRASLHFVGTIQAYGGGTAKRSDRGVLSVGRIESINGEIEASPFNQEQSTATTETPIASSVARVANRDMDYWGQAPSCSRTTSSSITNTVLCAGILPNGTTNMGPPAQVNDTPRMNNASVLPAHSPAMGEIPSANRMSMVTPSSAFFMPSPAIFGQGYSVSCPPSGSTLFSADWDEIRNGNRCLVESPDTEALGILDRAFGNGPSSVHTTRGGKGVCVENNEATPQPNKPRQTNGDDNMFGSPSEQISLDLCCLFCSPGNCQGVCKHHPPLRTGFQATTRPWTAVSGQWSPSTTSTGWSPIGREIHVLPAGSWGGRRGSCEASPSPGRMFASIIPPSVSGATHGASLRVKTSHPNSLEIQSSPSGSSTIDSCDFSRWAPSPLFATSICFSPIAATPDQKPSSENRAGIATLLDAALSAKVLNFEDSDISTGARKRQANNGSSGHPRTPNTTPTKKPNSISATGTPSVERGVRVPNQAAYRPSARRVSDVTVHNVDMPPLDRGSPQLKTNNLGTAQIRHMSPVNVHGPRPPQRILDALSPLSGNDNDHSVNVNRSFPLLMVSEAKNQQSAAASPMSPLKTSRRISC